MAGETWRLEQTMKPVTLKEWKALAITAIVCNIIYIALIIWAFEWGVE